MGNTKNKAESNNKSISEKEITTPTKNATVIILVSVLGLIYFLYSFYSKGFYQHDEIAHFLNMKDFWNDPNVILGNWSKPGYKLVYVLPSLLGIKFVTFINSILCALAVYFTYDILKKYNSQYAVLAVFILGLSPMWFQLSFRNYAEFTSVIMLLIALWCHQREKFIYAALLVSYASFTRQELFVVTGLYFWVLIFRKQYLPAVLTGTFAIVLHLWGYFSTGNMLFLYDYLFGYMNEISGAFLKPRGLQRIPELSAVLFGAIAPLLFIVYLGASLFLKKKLHYLVLVPLLSVYAYYALGDAEWFPSGIPINTRQLLINTPFLVILAILGLDRFYLLSADQKKWMLALLVPYIGIVWLFMSKTHNWVVLLDEDNYVPLFVSIATLVLLYLPTKEKTKIGLFALVALISLGGSFKKFENTEENKTMKRVANYYMRASKSKDGVFTTESKVYYTHPLFAFYQDKSKTTFTTPAEFINEETIKDIPKGSVIFWDSHYSYRPKEEGRKVKESYFLDRPNEYRYLNGFQSKDNRVKVSVFYKNNDRDTLYEKGLELINMKQYKEAIRVLNESLKNNPNSHSVYYNLGLAYQNNNEPNLALANYNKCLQIKNGYKEALLSRGKLYFSFNKLNESLADMNAYVKLNSQDPTAYFYLGNIYYGLKNFDQAIQYYDAVLKFNNNYADAYLNLGLCYIGKNDKNTACSNFNKAKELGNKNAEAQITQNCQ